ncbi:MAG: alanine racemase [candidate division KSB1 bacterium]|nr:alanine racemase [candidate division KSB1 bacterium]
MKASFRTDDKIQTEGIENKYEYQPEMDFADMPKYAELLRPAWVEVDLDAVAHNVRQIKAYLGNVKLLAVVKADGYGAGAIETARTIVESGADYLGVVMLEEAYELRRAGIQAPILNTGAVFPDQAEHVLALDLEQMIDRYETAAALSNAAVKVDKTARIHCKIDTGMSRYGFAFGLAAAEIARLVALPRLQIVGAFTHFPMSDGLDKSFALLQIERMLRVKRELEAMGITIPLWHMANSGGTLDLPQAHFDMVRVGLLNYGYWPSKEVRRPFEIKPAISLKARIVAVRQIGRGDSVGYGRKFIAEKDERIAVLPIGYADGYDRGLSKIGEVICKGRRLPIVGGLCMDAAFIKVTEWPDIGIGDLVTLMGKDGDEEISPHDIAALIGSVSYEVICRLGRRLPRVYVKNGCVSAVRNELIRES